MPATASRILATVNSSATTALHPEVPNLIAVVIFVLPDMSAAKPMCPGIDPDPEAVGEPKSSYLLSSDAVGNSSRTLIDHGWRVIAGPPWQDRHGRTAGIVGCDLPGSGLGPESGRPGSQRLASNPGR